MDEQECYRHPIPGASVFVRLRREDVHEAVNMVEHMKAVSRKAWEEPPWYCRIKEALENSWPDL